MTQRYSALYYPYIAVQDVALLKAALLLWDELHFVLPWNGLSDLYHREVAPAHAEEVLQAIELIGKPIVPDADARKIAAARIEELADSQLPQEFFDIPADPNKRFPIFEQKFDDPTWEKLRSRSLAVNEDAWGFREHAVNNNFGLLMMSILAHACAGEAYSPVTDQGAGYEALARIMAQGTPGQVQPGEVAALHDVRLPFLDLDEMALTDLIALRRREANGGADATDLQAMRHGFLTSMQKLGSDMTSLQGEERKERLRVYEQEMRGGAAKLKEGMKRKGIEVFNSKDVRLAVLGLAVGAGAVVAGGLAALPAAGAAMLQGAGSLAAVERAWALTGVLSKYKADRQDLINKSPVGYLYTASTAAKKPWFTIT